MTAEKLFDAIGKIDDEFIAQAENFTDGETAAPAKAKRISPTVIRALAAAALVAAVALGVVMAIPASRDAMIGGVSRIFSGGEDEKEAPESETAETQREERHVSGSLGVGGQFGWYEPVYEDNDLPGATRIISANNTVRGDKSDRVWLIDSWDDYVAWCDECGYHSVEEYVDDYGKTREADVWSNWKPDVKPEDFDDSFIVALFTYHENSLHYTKEMNCEVADGVMTLRYADCMPYFGDEGDGEVEPGEKGEVDVIFFARETYPGVTSVKAETLEQKLVGEDKSGTPYPEREESADSGTAADDADISTYTVHEDRFEGRRSSGEDWCDFKALSLSVPGAQKVYGGSVWAAKVQENRILSSWDQYVAWCDEMGYHRVEEYEKDGRPHVVDVWSESRPAFDRDYFNDNFVAVICYHNAYVNEYEEPTYIEYDHSALTLDVRHKLIEPAEVECVAGNYMLALGLSRSAYLGAEKVTSTRYPGDVIYLDENGNRYIDERRTIPESGLSVRRPKFEAAEGADNVKYIGVLSEGGGSVCEAVRASSSNGGVCILRGYDEYKRFADSLPKERAGVSEKDGWYYYALPDPKESGQAAFNDMKNAAFIVFANVYYTGSVSVTIHGVSVTESGVLQIHVTERFGNTCDMGYFTTVLVVDASLVANVKSIEFCGNEEHDDC